MTLRAFPVPFSHADGQICPFLLQMSDRQVCLYSQRDLRVFRPKTLKTRQKPVASKRGYHRYRQLLSAGLYLHQSGGVRDMVQGLAYLQGVESSLFINLQAATVTNKQL